MKRTRTTGQNRTVPALVFLSRCDRVRLSRRIAASGVRSRSSWSTVRTTRFEHGESGAPMTPEDGLTRFIESQCVRGSEQEVQPATFRRAYGAWCAGRKVTAVSTKELSTELRRFGVTLSRGRRPRVYLGVALRESSDLR
jgi:hypothetical protein